MFLWAKEVPVHYYLSILADGTGNYCRVGVSGQKARLGKRRHSMVRGFVGVMPARAAAAAAGG